MAGGMVVLGDPNRKYNLQQQTIDTQRDLANSQIQDAVLKRSLMPDQAAAENYARKGAGFAAFAQGGLTNATAKFTPDVINSEIAARGAQANAANAGADLSRANTSGIQQDLEPANAAFRAAVAGRYNYPLGALPGTPGAGGSNNPMGKPLGAYNPAQSYPGVSAPSPLAVQDEQARRNVGMGMAGFAAGTDDVEGFAAGGQVPGQGDGTQDKVNAKLAPHEAVLNAAAADFLGRDFIDKVNQAGAIAMGLNQKPNQPTAQPADGPGIPVGPGTPGAPPMPMGGAPMMPGAAAGNSDFGGLGTGPSAREMRSQRGDAAVNEAFRQNSIPQEQATRANLTDGMRNAGYAAGTKDVKKGAGKPAKKQDAKKASSQPGGAGKPPAKPGADMTAIIAHLMGGAGGQPGPV